MCKRRSWLYCTEVRVCLGEKKMTFPVDKEVGPDRPPPTDTLPLSVAAQRHSGAEDLAKHGGNPGASGDPLLAAPPGRSRCCVPGGGIMILLCWLFWGSSGPIDLCCSCDC